MPYIDIFDVPFVFKSMQELHQAVTGSLGRMIDEDLKKFNAKLLHVGHYGRSFEIANSVRPLKTAADFKGLKIRVNLPLSIESPWRAPRGVRQDYETTSGRMGSV